LKTVAVALVAIALALAAVLGALALQQGAFPEGPDAVGFVVATAVGAAALVALLYWPALAMLRRRGPLSARRAALVTALGLNTPVYLALLVLGTERQLFAGDEVLHFALGFAVVGLCFGAGYARVHREAAA